MLPYAGVYPLRLLTDPSNEQNNTLCWQSTVAQNKNASYFNVISKLAVPFGAERLITGCLWFLSSWFVCIRRKLDNKLETLQK